MGLALTTTLKTLGQLGLVIVESASLWGSRNFPSPQEATVLLKCFDIRLLVKTCSDSFIVIGGHDT